MLVQDRGGGRLRLVEQHEHGLVAGELAAAWRGPSGDDELSKPLILATALHDLGWRTLDEHPRLNPDTGLPHDFLSFPAEARYEAAAEGIDRVQELHPYAAVLVSLHYSELGRSTAPVEFLEEEEDRRLELLADLEDEPSPEELRRDLGRLQLLDRLSLHLCLAGPPARKEALPQWLADEEFGGVTGEPSFRVRWLEEGRAALSPFPFADPRLEVKFGVHEVEGAPIRSEDELERAWTQSREEVARVVLIPG